MSEAEKAEKKTGWRWGVNRWLILLVFIAGLLATKRFIPARPAIFLPAEALLGTADHPLFYIFGNPFYLTNTMVATILADIFLLIVVFFFVAPSYRKGNLQVPKGIAGVFEGLSEVFYNLTSSTAGKWTKTIFPWFAAISMLVLIMNWMELIPSVDAWGQFNLEHYVAGQVDFDIHDTAHLTAEQTAIVHELEEEYYTICDVKEFSFLGAEWSAISVNADHKDVGTGECGHAIVPFVRAVATDLNFTIALALVSVFMIQVVGVRALGLSYFEKFFNVRTLFSKPAFGLIDFVVGLFEIVSEFSKIISFSFRLFGNIFAGAVLLFVLGTLIPVGAQAAVLALEFMVGMIQAVVFGMLTMIFMSQATHSHFDEEHH
ncbi:MAG: F0F1 ATP synthase subunit A [Anaerolineales bacterium]